MPEDNNISQASYEVLLKEIKDLKDENKELKHQVDDAMNLFRANMNINVDHQYSNDNDVKAHKKELEDKFNRIFNK